MEAVMENYPLVSVIVPIYNTEHKLKRCVNSVLNQTLSNIEIILVDDESPDQAPKMCDEYAKKDSRVKVIHKKNAGLGMARNSGMEIATGKYVAFLDSDDYVSLNMYEKLYNRIKETQCDTCFCGCYVEYENGALETKPFRLGDIYITDHEEVIENVLANVLGASPEKATDNLLGMQVWRGLYSLELIRKYYIQFCSERAFICEDGIFHIDYFRYAKTFASVEEPLYYYCMYGESLSRVYREDRFEKNVAFYLEEKRRLEVSEQLNKLKPYIDRMFLALIRSNMRDAIKHMNSKNGYKTIKKMLSNNVLEMVIKQYPYKYNPLRWRVFHELIRHKCALAIFFVLKITK